MAGITLLIDLLRKKPALSNPSVFHSSNFFSSVVAASAAAASVAASRPLASSHIAYCDAGAAVWGDDYISNLHKGSESIFYDEAISYRVKEYPVELNPLFSAFGLKTLTMTTIRALLMFYLPLLEPRSSLEEDDDFPSDTEDDCVDLVTPLKKSMKQIFREIYQSQPNARLEETCQLWSSFIVSLNQHSEDIYLQLLQVGIDIY